MRMRSSIDQLKRKMQSTLKRAGIRRAAVFGSFASGKAGLKSDVDILIEAPAGMTLLGLVRLKNEFAAALAKDVDLVTYRGLSPYLRQNILRGAIDIVS